MRRISDTTYDDHPIDLLSRVGAAAIPSVEAMQAEHLDAIDRELVAMRLEGAAQDRARARRPMRRVALVAIAAAFAATPTMAFAGVLPDAAQRAASRIAATIGLEVPKPAQPPSTRAPEVARRGAERRSSDPR